MSKVDLDKYFRVLIHHKRVSNESFNFLLDRISQKLNAWKVKTLSLVGCLILSKVVILAIIQYFMQTNKVLMALYTSIEKRSQDFI